MCSVRCAHELPAQTMQRYSLDDSLPLQHLHGIPHPFRARSARYYAPFHFRKKSIHLRMVWKHVKL